MEALIWECPHCKDIVISYARNIHLLNICKCKRCFVDLEDLYVRTMGDVKELVTFDDDEYPFGIELLYCMIFQHPFLLLDKKYISLERYTFIEKLKDDLYKEVYLHGKRIRNKR